VKITDIELHSVAVPLPATFHPSWIPGFPQTENRFTLIRLRTEDGLEGVSAAPCVGREHEGLGSLLGPYLLGERADDIESIRQRIREMGYLGFRTGWIEPACWDIVGKARKKPVYELLGGKPGKVKLYASTGTMRPAADRIPEVESRLAMGFKGVKLRVHSMSLEQDIAHIRETRRAVGSKAILSVDANQGWRVAAVADAPRWDLERATAFCRAAEEQGFAWVEEPLAMDAYDDLAKLRKSVEIDIAGGELNTHGLPELSVMIEKGCYDIYQPDAIFTGGIAETWAIQKKVTAAGARYTPHTWTNGIGFAVNLQLFAACPNRDELLLEYPYDPPAWVEAVRDGVLEQPFRHRGGELELPTAPGLGFEVSARELKKHGTRFFHATKLRVAVATVLDKGLSTALEAGRTREARLAARHAELDSSGRDPALAVLG
jgi:D-galactarolactone cycloisomerase